MIEKKSIRSQFADTILKLSKKDNKIIVLVGDISHGIFSSFRKKYPTRYYNLGINETAMVNLSSGLSTLNYIPIVHTIAPFLIERTYEQIKLNFALQKQNINLVSIGSSFDYSKLGCTHHCYNDVSILSHFKDSKIFIPGNAAEFDYLFTKNYNKKGIKYYKIISNTVENFKKKKIDGAFKVYSGKDLTIATLPSTFEKVKKAKYKLEADGYNIEVIYFNTLKPFDYKIVNKSLIKTKKLLVVEDLSNHDGLLNLCLRSAGKVHRLKYNHIAIKDFIRTYGSYETLCSKVGLTTNNIIKQSLKLLNE